MRYAEMLASRSTAAGFKGLGSSSELEPGTGPSGAKRLSGASARHSRHCLQAPGVLRWKVLTQATTLREERRKLQPGQHSACGPQRARQANLERLSGVTRHGAESRRPRGRLEASPRH